MRLYGNRAKTIAWLVLILSLCVITISGARLWEEWQVYREGDDSYQRLAETVRLNAPAVQQAAVNAGSPLGEGGGTVTGEAGEQAQAAAGPDASITSIAPADRVKPFRPRVAVPDLYIDFETLQAVNKDAAAWLYNPGTAIDYPVMRATDYDYYLHHLPNRSANANGTLFIDYNWTDFSDRLTVIYGHNMRSGKMFGSLSEYKRQAYFNEHPYMYLYTADGGNFRVDLLYGCVIGAGQWRQRAFMFEENLDSLLAYAEHNTTFVSKAVYEPGDRVIALSTCSYEFDNARYVVLGVLRPEYAGD